MPTKVAELTADVTVNTNKMDATLSEVERSLQQTKKSMEQFSASNSGAQKAINQTAASTSKLKATTDQFRAGMANTAREVTKAREAVGGLGTSFSGVNVTLGGARAALMLLTNPLALVATGIAAVGVAVGAATARMIGWDQEMRNISASLLTVARDTGNTTESVIRMAAEIAQLGTQSSADLRAVATQMAVLGVSSSNMGEALRAATELAAAGIGDLRSNATLLGQAFQNPLQAIQQLEASGVRFTASQIQLARSFMESGQQGRAFGVVLEGINRQVGGAAAIQGAGVVGAFSQFREALSGLFTDMARTIEQSRPLQDALRNLTNIINSLRPLESILPQKTTEEINSWIEANRLFAETYQLQERRVAEASAALAANQRQQEFARSLRGDATAQLRELIAEERRLTADLRAQEETLARFHPLWREAAAALQAYLNEAERRLPRIEIPFPDIGFSRAIDQGNRSLEDLRRELEAARAPTEAAARALEIFRQTGLAMDPAQMTAGVRALRGEILGTLAAIDRAQHERSRMNITFSGLDTLKQSLQDAALTEQENFALRTAQLQAFLANNMLTQQQYNALLEAEFARSNYVIQSIEMQRQQAYLTAFTQTGQLAQELLQQLGQKSKAAAVAAVVVGKGLAIATTIQQGTAASMAALAPPPIGLGPVAGVPLAGAIKALTAVNVGIIAATGALQIGAALGGGGAPSVSGGGSSPSVPSAPDTGSMPTRIVIEPVDPGMIFQGEQLNELIEVINERAANGTIVVANKII